MAISETRYLLLLVIISLSSTLKKGIFLKSLDYCASRLATDILFGLNKSFFFCYNKHYKSVLTDGRRAGTLILISTRRNLNVPDIFTYVDLIETAGML